jgi:hypothetical protein
MHAEWSVEIGPDAPALEVPWRSEDGSVRHFDLKKQPELLLEIPETLEHFEMGDFLSGVNAKSEMTTAKCDVWLTDVMTVEDEIFGERMKRCSYVDIFFDREIERFDFAAHERLADLIVTKFGRLPEMPASLRSWSVNVTSTGRIRRRRATPDTASPSTSPATVTTT